MFQSEKSNPSLIFGVSASQIIAPAVLQTLELS